MEDLTIQYRYEMTGDGVRAVNAATGEVLKLATAEEKATQWAQALGQALADLEGVDLSKAAGGLAHVGGGHGGSSAPVGGTPSGGNADRLARAIDFLTSEIRRLPELLRSAVTTGIGSLTVPGQVTGSPGAGVSAPGTPGTGTGVPDLVDVDAAEKAKRRKEQQAFDRRATTGIGLAAAGIGIGATLAQADATPFADDRDRFWQTARQFNIPGTNIGVGGLRDIQLAMQRYGKGIDVDEEEKKNVEISKRDEIIRRPFDAFKLSWDQRKSELDRWTELAFGDVPDWRAMPVPPKPVFKDTGLRLTPDEWADYLSAKPSAAMDEKARKQKQGDADRFQQETANWQAAVDARRQRASPTFAPAMPLANLPELARGTLPGQQRFDEQMGRLAGRDRQVEARRDESASLAKLQDIDVKYLVTERRIVAARAEIDRLDRAIRDAPTDDANVTKNRLQLERRDAARDLHGGVQRLKELDDLKLQNEEETARARMGIREADTQMKRIELAQAQQREMTSLSQAARLTELGPAGRAQALAVAEIEKEAGYENLPAELRSMYQSAFPDTGRKKAEAAGQQFVGDFRAAAPDEFRDTVGPARETVNQLLQEIRKSEQESPGLLFKDILEAVRGTADRYGRLREELKAFIKQYEHESRVRHSEAGGGN
jgi:hypothetical protein